NSHVPELRAVLNVVGRFPAVIGGGAVANRIRRGYAATRKSHRPSAAIIQRRDPLPDFAEENGGAQAVVNFTKIRSIVDAHGTAGGPEPFARRCSPHRQIPAGRP